MKVGDVVVIESSNWNGPKTNVGKVVQILKLFNKGDVVTDENLHLEIKTNQDYALVKGIDCLLDQYRAKDYLYQGSFETRLFHLSALKEIPNCI